MAFMAAILPERDVRVLAKRCNFRAEPPGVKENAPALPEQFVAVFDVGSRPQLDSISNRFTLEGQPRV
jgi:hypothetical protein